MEITVMVEKILEPQRFQKNDGTVMVRNSFIGSTRGQYPKKVKFDVLNEEVFNKMSLMVGCEYAVSFDVESREWKERWYTSLNAWKAVCTSGQQPNTQSSQQQTQQPQQPQYAQRQMTPQPQQQRDADDPPLPF